jgi:hypothetical protein
MQDFAGPDIPLMILVSFHVALSDASMEPLPMPPRPIHHGPARKRKVPEER